MLAILSPAKTMKFDEGRNHPAASSPKFLSESRKLAKVLKKYSKPELMELMSISENLADLNTERFKNFSGDGKAEEQAPALFAFRGDVYIGLVALTLDENAKKRADDHIRILSGMYGILRPFDLIEPYRLEMGTNLKTDSGDNLYEFWGDKITEALKNDLKKHKSDAILNLASNEYVKVIDQKAFEGKWIDVDFREIRKGKLRFVSFNAKKARGMMARFVLENNIRDRYGLTKFDGMGYLFDKYGSEENKLLFVKPE